MTQTKLYATIARMKPGQWLDLPRKAIWDAAQGELTSVLMDGPIRGSDVAAFIRKMEQNWGVKVHQDILSEKFTIQKY